MSIKPITSALFFLQSLVECAEQKGNTSWTISFEKLT